MFLHVKIMSIVQQPCVRRGEIASTVQRDQASFVSRVNLFFFVKLFQAIGYR